METGMPAVQETVDQVKAIDVDQYKYGFVTDVEMELAPKGLDEDIVRYISKKKGEPDWMTDWRLEAYRRWRTMSEPKWARVDYPPIDYQDLYYYAAPKNNPAPRSLDEVVGQDHLLAPDGTITRMLERGSLASLILWGPPGCGKTTIARLLAARSGLHFVQLSAVFSGVADLKRPSRRRRGGGGPGRARCCSSTRYTASTAPSRTVSCRWWRMAPSHLSARRPKILPSP